MAQDQFRDAWTDAREENVDTDDTGRRTISSYNYSHSKFRGSLAFDELNGRALEYLEIRT